MKISTKGRYALRMMLDLAVHDTGEYISLKDISERQDITVKYLEQIVTALTKSGFLRSQRGNNGGYRLARRPADYTVGSILRIMEGSRCRVWRGIQRSVCAVRIVQFFLFGRAFPRQ